MEMTYAITITLVMMAIGSATLACMALIIYALCSLGKRLQLCKKLKKFYREVFHGEYDYD